MRERYAGHLVELLPNGFVRVDSPSGSVTLYEAKPGSPHIYRRSGYGTLSMGLDSVVGRMLGLGES